MKFIKWAILSLWLFTAPSSHSQLTVLLGFDCFHNGEYYTTVMTNVSCPDPSTGLSSGWGFEYMDKHDPNDHECVISRVARVQT